MNIISLLKENKLENDNKGRLICIYGRPVKGKSTLSLDIITKVITKNNKCLIFNLEDNKEKIVKEINERLDTLKLERSFIDNLVIEDTSSITIDDIENKCSNIKDLKLIVIDYLQLVNGNKEEILDELKELSSKLKITIIVLSQLPKKYEFDTFCLGQLKTDNMDEELYTSRFDSTFFLMKEVPTSTVDIICIYDKMLEEMGISWLGFRYRFIIKKKPVIKK